MAQNGSKSPECLENDFRNYHHWNFALIVVVLVGQMTNLGRFRVWGQHDLGVKKITEIVYCSKVSALLFSSGEQSKKGLKIHFSIVIFYETPLPNFSHIKDNPRTVLVHFQAI